MALGFAIGSVGAVWARALCAGQRFCGAMMINGIAFTPLPNHWPMILFPRREIFLARTCRALDGLPWMVGRGDLARVQGSRIGHTRDVAERSWAIRSR